MKLNFTEETTLAEYLNYWFYTFSIRKISQNTHRDYIATINKHIIPKIGDIPLVQCKSDVLQDFLNNELLYGNLRSGGRLSVKTVINFKGLLFEAFEKAVILEYLPLNYVRGTELPQQLKDEMIVFSPSEEIKIKAASLLEENLDYGFAFWLIFCFGLRNGEVCALKWTDFDFDKCELYIHKSVKREYYNSEDAPQRSYLYLGTPKTNNSIRRLPFTEKIRDEIYTIQQKRIGNGYYARHNAARTDFRNMVFVSNSGEYVNPGTMNRRFKSLLNSIGINNPKYHVHSIRHTFATRGIEKGVDVKTLSEILGHSSVQFTLDRYAHVLSAQKRKVMEIMLSDE